MAAHRLTATRDDRGTRLDAFVVQSLPGLAIDRARSLIHEGRVRIRGKPCAIQRKLWGGEEIDVDIPAPVAAAGMSGPVLPILYEDRDVVVVDKPPGMVVEPTPSIPSVVSILAARLKDLDVGGIAQPGVVHRLDRDTSGCLVLARNDAAVASLKKSFDEKRIEKRYVALVLGSPPDELRLDSPYGRSIEDPRLFTTHVVSARRAVLSFKVMERYADGACVDIALETGRTHQIRVQLLEAGYPVIGDSVYGPQIVRSHPVAVALGRHALHSRMLNFPQPSTGQMVQTEAALPRDLRDAMERLRSGQ